MIQNTSIIIYTSNMCSSCQMAKEYMKLREINFSEKNVSTDLDAQLEINKLGFDTTPIIVIGNEIIDGFDAPKIEDAIKHLNN